MIQKKLILAGLALLPALNLQAVLSVTGSSYSYSQNFDSLAQSGTDVAWANDSTLAGWSLYQRSGTAIDTTKADEGGNNAGSFYSYGLTSSSDRALGGVASGSAYFGTPASGAVAGWIAVAFANNSGALIDSFTLGFDGEQWRNSGAADAQSMTLQYGLGSTFETVSSWVTPGGAFNWTSPIHGGTAGAIDGNGTGQVSGLGGAINSIAWDNGSTLWIRWVEMNDAGNDHGLAIDNFTFSTLVPVPEPAETAALTALALAGFAGLFVGRRLLRERRQSFDPSQGGQP